jgi:error-prone DNA polymerase
MRLVRGLPESAAEAIAGARRAGPFRSWHDFVRRSGLRQPALVKLAQAGALDSLGLDRRAGLWQALERPAAEDRPLLASLEEDEHRAPLAPLSDYQEVLADYHAAGLTLRKHPLAFFRARLDAMRVLRSEQLAQWPAGRIVRVAGLVLVRQRPGTAQGLIFMTLEDETGVANLIVRPEIWQRYHRIASRSNVLLAQGHLEKQGQVIHILVQRLSDLAALLREIDARSRDFH